MSFGWLPMNHCYTLLSEKWIAVIHKYSQSHACYAVDEEKGRRTGRISYHMEKNLFLELYRLLNNFTSRTQRHRQFRPSNSDWLRQWGCGFPELFYSFALYYQFRGISYCLSSSEKHWFSTWQASARASAILRIAWRYDSHDPTRRQ